ncbi:MAG TPA: L,D-transpeptidase [Acidimicrobiales bacterium]|jgi:lipoprotein-anchoring transpeptidase ErfK/SrfK|nr:L,D-transpeptidase [Acidimicrobiales bacterium]
MTRRILAVLSAAVLFSLSVLVAAPGVVSAQEAPPGPPPVPAESGDGRRVVYSNGQQRVWLVEADGTVARTYLVSGRKNYPRRGTYSVFSRSEHTRSGAVRMQYMVRFTKSARTNVGFHSIPVDRRGRLVQSTSQLGTPRSRGCVRQSIDDARFLWEWAPIGTVVVVTP